MKELEKKPTFTPWTAHILMNHLSEINSNMKSLKRNPSIIIYLTALALMAFDFSSGLMITSGSPIDLYQESSVRFNDVDIKIVATGKTSGHIADAHIMNNSRKKTTVSIAAGEIPKEILTAREARQGFFVTEPLNLEIPGKTNITVPIRGYCNDPTLDPPAPGTTLPNPDKWNTPLDDIQTISKIIKTTEKLQREGLINTPISSNPAKERDIVIQQVVWLYSIENHDPCQSIRQLLTGDPSGTGGEHEDYGVSQIMDAVRRVGRSSGLESFTPPALPAQAGEVQSPIQTNRANLKKELSVILTGTGETTGQIGLLTVSNPNDHPIVVRVGTGDIAGSDGFFIPASGREQPYIVPSIPDIPVGAGETVKVPVEGYCVDIRRPPVPAGDQMPPLSSWVSLPTDPPSITQTPDGTPIVYVPTRTALPQDQAEDILLGGNNGPNAVSIRPWMPNAAKSGWDCPTSINSANPTFPGTDDPIVNNITPEEHLGVLVPVLLQAINNIIETTDVMQAAGEIRTPFSSNPRQEREAVIQQTFWIYSSAVSGNDYPKKEFESNTYEQFETATGQPLDNLPPAQKKEIDYGVEDFWNTFQAVGAGAKILPPPVKPVLPTTTQENMWQTAEKRRIPPAEATPDRSPKVAEKREPDYVPKMVAEHSVPDTGDSIAKDDKPKEDDKKKEPEDEPCKCNNMTFDLVIRRENNTVNSRGENIHNDGIVIENTSQAKEVEIDVKDWKEGDFYIINLMRGKMNCSCINAVSGGTAESVDCDFYARSKNSNQKNKLYISKDPSGKDGVESMERKGVEKHRTDFRFAFNPEETKSKVITFCFSAYCFSNDCNVSKSGVKCEDYCLELTFKMGE